MVQGNGRSLHVLLVSHRFASDAAGGTEVLTKDLAAALVTRGHEVSWLAVGDPPSEEPPSPWAHLPLPATFDPGYPARWREQEERQASFAQERLAARPPVDIVHVTHFSRVGLALLERPPLAGVPVVATLTDYTVVCPDYQLLLRGTGKHCEATAPSSRCLRCLGLPEAWEREIASWRARNRDWLNRRVRAFWTQTPHQARELGRGGISMRRLVRDTACYAVPQKWASLQTSPAEPGYVLFLGRCSPEKGLHVLLDAFLAWPGDLRLVLATLPDDQTYESQLRARTKHDPRIEWVTGLPRTDIGRLLAGSRAIVVPSQWYENHPLVAREAWALGVPVYCSAVPSMAHLAGAPGMHLVARYENPGSWVAVLDAIRNGSCRGEARVEHCLREFDEFVDEIVDIYLAQVTT